MGVFFKNKFKDYDLIFDYLVKNKNVNMEYILQHLLYLNYSVFNVFLFSLPKKKKKKKKSKTKYIKLFIYTKPNKRSSKFIKDLSDYSRYFNYDYIETRCLSSFLTILLSQKESVLYKKKIYA